jgi:hypothetical protein
MCSSVPVKFASEGRRVQHDVVVVAIELNRFSACIPNFSSRAMDFALPGDAMATMRNPKSRLPCASTAAVDSCLSLAL